LSQQICKIEIVVSSMEPSEWILPAPSLPPSAGLLVLAPAQQIDRAAFLLGVNQRLKKLLALGEFPA